MLLLTALRSIKFRPESEKAVRRKGEGAGGGDALAQLLLLAVPMTKYHKNATCKASAHTPVKELWVFSLHTRVCPGRRQRAARGIKFHGRMNIVSRQRHVNEKEQLIAALLLKFPVSPAASDCTSPVEQLLLRAQPVGAERSGGASNRERVAGG